MKDIIIKGAREHNLKNIDLTLPKEKLIVITGLSGSGKSTLAFDTLYAEGQRRYVESLSAYARQFLGLMSKPDVDSIEGLSPAIAIEQKTTSKNPRSTVGTVTEIYDYLRLLFARIGTPFCPKHNEPIISQTAEEIVNKIAKDYKDQVTILSPIIRQKKGTYEQLLKDLNKEGYARVRLNSKITRTDEKITLSRYQKHDIDAVIDRVETEDISRLTEAVENALKKSDGLLIVQDKDGKDKLYSANMTCPKCDTTFEELQPRMFSFNSPFGACEECHGLGMKIEFDEDLVIPDKSLTLIDGAIACYPKQEASWRMTQIQAAADEYGFDLFTPIEKMKKKHLDILLYGTGEEIYKQGRYGMRKLTHGWEGIIPQQERLLRETSSDYRKKEMEKYMRATTCPICKGKRLKDKILSVKIQDKSIIDVTEFSIKEAREFFSKLKLTEKEAFIGKQVLKEIKERIEFLNNVGLSYLNLSRSAGTLSGGEAQRIRLATQIGSNLTGVLYVLDEPSIGLHQRDNDKLIKTLHKLRDLGNTLVVVEHDEDTIMSSDYVIDIGPGAGIHGGEVVAKGTPKELVKNKKSLTGQYLSGKEEIAIPKQRRKLGLPIQIKGAEENNLKKIDVDIPTQCLTLVTGVSGSGKSTLINGILQKGLAKKINKASKEKPGKHKGIYTDAYIDKVIVIDQSPIGKTPRSNPATYTKLFDDIRNLFAETKDAKLRGYKPGRFSFNVKGGRCEKCQGDGTIKIEMNFLPDVYVECEECKGGRYNKETLEVKYKDKSIADVLAMDVEEALEIFQFVPNIRNKLQTLVQVGLEYIKLGQSATTLSGGESQRIKLTKELAKRSTGRTLYILDEPTTGLHFHDVKKLIDVIQGLVDKGNTMVVIEHNLDVIKCADHIIDLGPEGGDGGGEIIAIGTPEEVAKVKESWTGKYLKKLLEKDKKE
ncbi:MAG: excinuclease ABC subunit UvrA [Nitrosarchaeum sp.]